MALREMLDLNSRSSNDGFRVARYLELLRRSIGDSDFGYRVQGMFANLLVQLGWSVIEVKAQGHPDVRARQGEREMLVEIEFVAGFRRRHTVKQDDLDGTQPRTSQCVGYLALLDLAPPASWSVIDSHILRGRGAGTLPMVTLRALAEKSFSRECSGEFISFVTRHEIELRNLSYHTLVERAIAGYGW